MIHQFLVSQFDSIQMCLGAISLLFTFSYQLLLITHTLILIIAIGFGFYFYYTRKKLIRQLKRAEQQLILSQINPHFYFNSLTALQSYIFRNDANQASKFLSSFSKFVRLALELSRQDFSSIDQEVKLLNLYFELQTMRFEDKFDYKIEVDKNLDIELPSIPPLLTQPFVENAIEHGIIQLKDKGLIIVRFIKMMNLIIIEIDDNGIGIDNTMHSHLRSGKNPHKFVKDFTKARIQKIQEISNICIFMDIIDKSTIDPEIHGTTVKLTIPIN